MEADHVLKTEKSPGLETGLLRSLIQFFFLPSVTFSHAFSRAWRKLHLFARSSDWSIFFNVCFDWSELNYSGFGLTTHIETVLSVTNVVTFKKQQIAESITADSTAEI